MKKLYTSFLLLSMFVSLLTHANSFTVQVSNFQFTPSTVNATVGDTINFVWVSGSHTTTCNGASGSVLPSGAPAWNSPMNSVTNTFQYVLSVPGTYTYVCIPHAASMIGTINASPAIVTSKITFRVDMTNEVISGGGVHIAGSFNGWSATASPMTNIGNNVYEAVFDIDNSLTVQYVFLKDSSYNGQEAVPAACGVSNGFGGYNRNLDVPDNDSALATVCYSSCAACPPLIDITFKVDMTNETIAPGGVHIAGSFNGWSATATPMTNIGNNVYRKKIKIPAGQTIQYTYLKDSTYNGQETVPAACGVSNGFGGYNRELTIPAANLILPTVCYSGCGACVVNPNVNVTLRVDMANETLGLGGAHIAGSFNGWSATATPMTLVSGTVYEAVITIDSTLTFQYTFLKDSSYNGQETVPAACGVSNGFGGYNRELVVPQADVTLPTVCYSSCGICVPPGTVNVTFRVDVSQEPTCPGGPHLAGSFNGWNAAATPMTAVGGGVYEASLQLDTTLTVTYKFLNDSTYNCGNENVPMACGVPNGFGGYNRSFEVPESDSSLATVCFGSCSACVPPPLPDSVNVTFRVDMSQTPACANGPHIVGTFNGFSATANPMTAVGGGIYEFTIKLDTGNAVQYKFLNDDSYSACGNENVPAACGVPNGFGGYNRFLTVPASDTTLDVVCFNSCSACIPPPLPDSVNVTFRVDMSQTPACANGPHIVGTFNGFSSTANPMTAIGGGIYEFTIKLDTGNAVQYKFLNDNSYSACGNENVPAACGVPNGFGGYNRFLTVPTQDTTLATVCFNSCSACVPVTSDSVNVTFQIDMTYTPLGPGGVHIAGSFNGWSATATPMVNVGGGAIYQATFKLDSTSTVQYTFLKDSTYNGQEVIDSTCGVPNGFGGFNRQLVVPESDSTLFAYCYSSCFGCPTAIENNTKLEQISVYPNPTQNTINVVLNVSANETTLRLMSMEGKVIINKTVNAQQDKNISFDLSQLTSGIYMLEVVSEKQTSVTKVIKQ